MNVDEYIEIEIERMQIEKAEKKEAEKKKRIEELARLESGPIYRRSGERCGRWGE
jgi:hypothetical protein